MSKTITLYTLFFIGIPCITWAQRNDIGILEQFTRYFNNQQTDSMYSLMSDTLQRNLPKNEFEQILQERLYPLGNLDTFSHIPTHDVINYYHLKFSKTDLKLALQADSNGLVTTFFLQPYEVDTTSIPPVEKTDTIETKIKGKSAHQDIDRLIDSIAFSYTRLKHTQGLAIGILNKGRTGYYFYGKTGSTENTLPDRETIFEIGDITKTFTATLLAHHILQKEIELTDSIIKFLPDSVASNPFLAPITIGHLVANVSGLPSLPDNISKQRDYDPKDPFKNYSRAALFEYLMHFQAAVNPDSVFLPSDLGYGLIGEILAMRNQSSYNELIQELICQPLALNATTEFPTSEMQSLFVQSFDKDGKIAPHWHFQSLSGSGALKSNLSDLLRYLGFNLNRVDSTTLSKAFELTKTPQWIISENDDYAMGWNIRLNGDRKFYWQEGSTSGAKSFLGYIAEKNIGIVILTNTMHGIQEMAMQILEAL